MRQIQKTTRLKNAGPGVDSLHGLAQPGYKTVLPSIISGAFGSGMSTSQVMGLKNLMEARPDGSKA